MFRRFCIAIMLLLAGIQIASAQATITTRTTGVTTSSLSFPGVLEMPAGVPYELRISAQFPSTLAPSSNSYYSTNAQVDAVLVIDGVEHVYSGRGVHSFSYTLLHLNGVPRTSFTQNVAFDLPGGDLTIFLLNSIGVPASELPADDVSDIFTLGSGSFALGSDNYGSVSMYDWEQSQWAGSVTNRPATFEFSAALVAIPEPQMALMLAAGLALLGSATRIVRHRA